MIRQAIRLDIRGLPSFGTRRRPNRLLRASQSYISRSSHLVISELFSSNSAFLPLPKLDVCHFSSTVKPTTKKGRRKYVPRKAAVELTEKARAFFKRLLDNSPNQAGIMLNYQQASTGQPRMVFSFDFVTKEQLSPTDEGVSLEVNDDGSPKTPAEAVTDGMPKLYVNGNAFLKVLGATVDVDMETITPVLYDREGNRMDPNA